MLRWRSRLCPAVPLLPPQDEDSRASNASLPSCMLRDVHAAALGTAGHATVVAAAEGRVAFTSCAASAGPSSTGQLELDLGPGGAQQALPPTVGARGTPLSTAGPSRLFQRCGLGGSMPRSDAKDGAM